MEKVMFKKILKDLNLFINKEISSEEFDQRFSEVKIGTYMPLLEKATLITNLTMYRTIFDNNLPEVLVSEIERTKLFGLLFAYTNIELEDGDNTLENYDKIVALGIFDAIYERCKKDYDKLEKMFDTFISSENMMSMAAVLRTLDTDAMNTNKLELQELFKGLDKETIDNLSKIFIGLDPSVKNFVQAMSKQAVKDVKKK